MNLTRVIVDTKGKEHQVTLEINQEELEFFLDMAFEASFNILRELPIEIAKQISKQIPGFNDELLVQN